MCGEHVRTAHIVVLADNGIGPEGATHLASTLPQCLHMRTLKLNGLLGVRGGTFCLCRVGAFVGVGVGMVWLTLNMNLKFTLSLNLRARVCVCVCACACVWCG